MGGWDGCTGGEAIFRVWRYAIGGRVRPLLARHQIELDFGLKAEVSWALRKIKGLISKYQVRSASNTSCISLPCYYPVRSEKSPRTSTEVGLDSEG